MTHSRSITEAVICLGEYPKQDGTIHEEHKNRVDLAVTTCASDECILVLTGGVTQKDTPAEAVLAQQYLVEKYGDKITLITLLEDRSMSTAQNFVFTRELLAKEHIAPTTITIVGRKSQLPKAVVYARKTWPGVKLRTIVGIDTKPLWYKVADSTLFRFLAYLDLEEQFHKMLFKFKVRK